MNESRTIPLLYVYDPHRAVVRAMAPMSRRGKGWEELNVCDGHDTDVDEAVRRFLRRIEPAVRRCVVAVSGGADSTALALALAGAGVDVVVAHLNHCLRGQESDADEAFVARFGEENTMGLRLTTVSARIDVATEARLARANLEAEARRLRYGWLARVAKEHGIAFVATGHSANDQAETVLHRILRGTGLKGLRGIAERRRLAPGVEVIRPLLYVRREAIVNYLADNGQSFREDATNRDRRMTRNRIRHELLPHLQEEYGCDIVGALGRLAAHSARAYERWSAGTAALLVQIERPRAGAMVVLDRRGLNLMASADVCEVLRHVFEREGWPMGRLGLVAWERLTALVRTGGSIDLPEGVRARVHEGVVQIWREC